MRFLWGSSLPTVEEHALQSLLFWRRIITGAKNTSLTQSEGPETRPVFEAVVGPGFKTLRCELAGLHVTE